MAASTLDTYAGMLKERYVGTDLIEKLVFSENVFLEMLKKRGSHDIVGGKYIVVPIQYGIPNSTGANFALAQATANNTRTTPVQVGMGDYFGVVRIGEKTMASSETNSQAFFKNEVLEVDGLYVQAGERLSYYSTGNGGGAIAKIATAGISGNVLTLTSAPDAANFEVGGWVCASGDGDGSLGTETLRGGGTGAAAQITNVSRAAGTITLNDATLIPGLAAGDWLSNQGDFYGVSGNPIIMRGLQAWVAASDTPPPLWNVSSATRSIDPQRFAGCRMPTSELVGLGLDERLSKAGAFMRTNFKTRVPTAGWCNPLDWQVLETQLRGKGYRAETDDSTKWGFTSIKYNVGGTLIPIRADRHIPRGQFYLIREDDFGLHWLSDELIYPQGNGTSNKWMPMYNSTDVEFRLISHPAFVNYTPRNQMRFSTPGFDS